MLTANSDMLESVITRRGFLAAAAAVPALPAKPAAYGAVPSPRQLHWHELETTAFLHFTVNTFTNKEWGYGDEDPNIFNPTAFDADAIVSALAYAGMRGVILTCKHHDGFCLWPTKTTDHSVRKSSWKSGEGDVVRAISDSARRHKLEFGVYLSPWDRNSAAYGTPDYIRIYRAQLTELLTNYGPIFEVWHDGANGGDGYYGGAREKRSIDRNTYYDWPGTWELTRKLQPNACIFSDVGPDVRWVGNERGIAGDPCWATYDPVGANGGPASPGNVRERESPAGTRHGSHWLPAECDVSIRPGWFWHEAENARVKTPAQLIDLYYKSVGRGANLLLNVPPNREGLLQKEDIESLKAFGDWRRKTFGVNRAAKAKLAQNTLTFPHPVEVKVVRLREDIRQGQRIDAAVLENWNGASWETAAHITSVGPRRLIAFEKPLTATRLRLRVTESVAPPLLAEFSVW
jgi:alpha-L-fucosidase